MSRRRVVVTGMGTLSPAGLNVAESWENIVAGKSGIGLIESFDTSAYNTRFGGAVKNLNVDDYMSAKDARKMDLFIQYGMIASMQAIEDSGIECTPGKCASYWRCCGVGNWWPDDDREELRCDQRPGAKESLTLLRAGQHHKYDFRKLID